MEPVRVRVLHLMDCPSTPPTIQRIEEVAGGLAIPIALETLLVETGEQAQSLRFLGSPTVQVEARDIEPDAQKGRDFGLT